MKQSVNFNQFCDAFQRMGRESQFSYEGKRALFNYLDDLEENVGEEIELDVVALCCDFTEYENLKELQENYSDIEDMDDLEKNTTVIPIEDSEGFIIVAY